MDAHRAPITDLCMDMETEWLASSATDGSVMVHNLYGMGDPVVMQFDHPINVCKHADAVVIKLWVCVCAQDNTCFVCIHVQRVHLYVQRVYICAASIHMCSEYAYVQRAYVQSPPTSPPHTPHRPLHLIPGMQYVNQENSLWEVPRVNCCCAARCVGCVRGGGCRLLDLYPIY